MVSLARVEYLPFSWVTFASMLALLGASVTMYVVLVRRWTSRRLWVALGDWARENGFRRSTGGKEGLPAALLPLLKFDEQIRFRYFDEQTTFLQFIAAAAPDGASARFNVLIRRRPTAGAVAALRPAAPARHLIDLLPMSEFASMTLGERFVVYANDSHVAQQLAESPLLTLVPKDVGLILLEEHLVLDFSSRPFDPIEFGRMIVLSDQLMRILK